MAVHYPQRRVWMEEQTDAPEVSVAASRSKAETIIFMNMYISAMGFPRSEVSSADSDSDQSSSSIFKYIPTSFSSNFLS